MNEYMELEVWNIKDDPIPDLERVGMVNERFLQDSGTDDVKWNFEFVSVKDMANKIINKKYNNNKDGRNYERNAINEHRRTYNTL